MRSHILIVDGNNLMARQVHTHMDLTTAKGGFTGGLYGFLQSLRSFVSEMPGRARGIIVCLDSGVPGFRRRLCPEYKANRISVEELLKKKKLTKKEREALEFREKLTDQMRRLPSFLDGLGICVARADDFEADDVAAFLVRKIYSDVPCVLLSGDHDWSQLISRNCIQFLPNCGFLRRVPKTYKIRRAIEGDNSDNVKGVPGIGSVGALQLVTAHSQRSPTKFVESVLKNPQTMFEKRFAEHVDNFNAAFRVMDLSRSARMIAKNARVKFSVGPIDAKQFQRSCRKLDMQSFLLTFGDTIRTFRKAYERAAQKGTFERLEQAADR